MRTYVCSLSVHFVPKFVHLLKVSLFTLFTLIFEKVNGVSEQKKGSITVNINTCSLCSL
jgi:hypothetical protein